MRIGVICSYADVNEAVLKYTKDHMYSRVVLDQLQEQMTASNQGLQYLLDAIPAHVTDLNDDSPQEQVDAFNSLMEILYPESTDDSDSDDEDNDPDGCRCHSGELCLVTGHTQACPLVVWYILFLVREAQCLHTCHLQLTLAHCPSHLPISNQPLVTIYNLAFLS